MKKYLVKVNVVSEETLTFEVIADSQESAMESVRKGEHKFVNKTEPKVVGSGFTEIVLANDKADLN